MAEKKSPEIEKEIRKAILARDDGKLIRLKLKDIKPYPKNAKIHTEKQVTGIMNSMISLGYRDKIEVDQNNVIIAGHGRLRAFYMIDTTGTKEITVMQYKGYTDSENKAYRIAHNKLSLDTGFDVDVLKEEFYELEGTENFTDTGFEVSEITKMLDKDKEVIEDTVEVGAYERAKKLTKIKPGQIYLLGDHRLMCGDSTESQQVEKLMNGVKADMVFTDPPYGIEFKSNYRSVKHKKINNDDKILDFNYALEKCTNDIASIYIFTRWDVYPDWLNIINLHIKNLLIWNKGGNATMGDLQGNYKSCHEFLMFFTKGRPLLNDGRDVNIWDIQQSGQNNLHPTMKPIELCARAIKNSAPNTILDLFGGSGSTLIACEQLDRKCFMMELDPVYCQVIIDRWEKFTNKKAIKA